VTLEELSYPDHKATRRHVADALVRTSADPDAFERLRVSPTLAPQVIRNLRLFELPAMPVLELYTGPLHGGLAASGWSTAAAERAGECLVVVSALWGPLRPRDRIPPYRLLSWAYLLDIGRPDGLWRTVLPDALAEAAGSTGLVIDLRSSPAQGMGMPKGLGDRLVTLRVDQGRPGNRIGDVIAKRVRGEAARHLLESGTDPADPHELADVLADRWAVRIASPERRGKPWALTLTID
jgi:cytoplasmic iron level regulating protein YaaA (DUF328/UPF0246 family)